MTDIRKIWEEKDSPLWLLHLSRALLGELDFRKTKFPELVSYVAELSSGRAPDFKDPGFMEHVPSSHREFFGILGKEAVTYYNALHTETKENLFAQELIDQVQNIYGPESVTKFLMNQDSMEAVAGNMTVAIAMNAIAESALIEYLHLHGKLSDEEKQAGLAEINNRLDRIGIHGVDRLLQSRPELERFIETDVKVIDARHITGAPANEMTRAAAYGLTNVADRTLLRQQVISPDSAELERKKDHYIRIHARDLPPLDPDARKKYAQFAVLEGRGTRNDHKKKGKLADQIDRDRENGDFSSHQNAMLTVLYDGIAVNHPQRDLYAVALRQRIGGIESDVIDAARPRRAENPRLPSGGTGDPDILDPADRKGAHVRRLTTHDEQNSHKKKEAGDSGEDHKEKTGNAGAAIATIGGAAAVGLLLAAGRDKEQNDKDGEEGKHRSKALKFAALAAASAVTAGGVIMWTKKPEFLYKPIEGLFKSLGSGRA